MAAPITGLTKMIVPYNPEEAIAVVCNGQMEFGTSLEEKIKRCSTVIGVDGGINHCSKLNVTPSWFMGDFDSIDPDLYQKISTGENALKFQRAKDFADIEAGIDKAKEISSTAKIIIFAGLGGRIDHSLTNILIMLRNPCKTFLETKDQMVFALNSDIGEVTIDDANYKNLFIIPLYNNISGVNLTVAGKESFYNDVEKNRLFHAPISGISSLSIGKGEAIVCLDKQANFTAPIFSGESSNIQFTIDTQLSTIFSALFHQSQHFQKFELNSSTERVVNIQQSSGEVIFDSKVGQTISLIPFNGPAKGLKTNGLKWELDPLDPSGVSALTKDFIGISNVSMKEKFSVSITSGEVLCIVNTNLMDQEMVEAKIN